MVDDEQEGSGVDLFAHTDGDVGHDAVRGRRHVVLHLHRFEHHEQSDRLRPLRRCRPARRSPAGHRSDEAARRCLASPVAANRGAMAEREGGRAASARRAPLRPGSREQTRRASSISTSMSVPDQRCTHGSPVGLEPEGTVALRRGTRRAIVTIAADEGDVLGGQPGVAPVDGMVGHVVSRPGSRPGATAHR